MNITVTKKILNKYIPESGIIKIIIEMLSYKLANIIKNSGLKVQHKISKINQPTYYLTNEFYNVSFYKITNIKYNNTERSYRNLYVSNYKYPNITTLEIYRNNGKIISIYSNINISISIYNMSCYVAMYDTNNDTSKIRIIEKIDYHN